MIRISFHCFAYFSKVYPGTSFSTYFYHFFLFFKNNLLLLIKKILPYGGFITNFAFSAILFRIKNKLLIIGIILFFLKNI